MSDSSAKLGFNGAWSMAVGGMIGGGIFATLGVVVSISGALTWLSFLSAGLIALATGYSYVKLASLYQKSGGAFTYLREIGADSVAGTLSWILLVGYVLTNSVYAFTFGQYLGYVLDLGPWVPRASAFAIMVFFIGINLRGVAEAGGVEIFLVWVKLIVLVGLAAWGLAEWQPEMLSRGVPDASLGAALFGAATVFMAYEGFQLLAYDYDDIHDPDRILPLSVLLAIVVVIAVYILVALGTVMLIGADQVVKHEEVALAVAGREVLGVAGVVIVTIAAAFSTGSAINSTLFATARLAHTVASADELPKMMTHQSHAGIPDRAVMTLGFAAAILAVIGTLTTLVEAASLSFLVTFAVVCGLAFHKKAGRRWITGFGALAAAASSVALVVRLISEDPVALAFFVALVVAAVVVRPLWLRHGN